LLNSVLFCVVGGALIARYFLTPAPFTLIVLGVLFLAFGVYRLALARREMQKRVGSRV